MTSKNKKTRNEILTSMMSARKLKALAEKQEQLRDRAALQHPEAGDELLEALQLEVALGEAHPNRKIWEARMDNTGNFGDDMRASIRYHAQDLKALADRLMSEVYQSEQRFRDAQAERMAALSSEFFLGQFGHDVALALRWIHEATEKLSHAKCVRIPKKIGDHNSPLSGRRMRAAMERLEMSRFVEQRGSSKFWEITEAGIIMGQRIIDDGTVHLIS